jgi:hypothetical protein
MLPTSIADTHWNGLKLVTGFRPKPDRRGRILAALGPLGEHFPSVDEETLARYYKYLAAKLSFPFAACYPAPTSALEEQQQRCSVLALLDPSKGVCDEFDGIFCKTRKGRYEINLPLVELEVPEDDANFQLIEDYWYWFWNWR